MDLQLIAALWKIVEVWGSNWIVFVVGFALWWKLDKKDQKIYELIEVISKMNASQDIHNEKLQSLTQIVLQILNKNDK